MIEKNHKKIIGRKIKIAIVGWGRIAQTHFAVINQSRDYELKAICDKNDKAVYTSPSRW